MKHFAYYPKIEYSGVQATNIMVRGKIRDAILEKAALYYDYVISDGERPDVIASKYYGNSTYTWAIFYANNIFDPQLDWPMDSDTLNTYIIKKYGSVSNARNTDANFQHYMLDGKYVIDKTRYLDNNFPDRGEDNMGQNVLRKTKMSHLDYEIKLNDEKRQIKILDKVYLLQITNELKNLFKD